MFLAKVKASFKLHGFFTILFLFLEKKTFHPKEEEMANSYLMGWTLICVRNNNAIYHAFSFEIAST